jgi:signal peptidase I
MRKALLFFLEIIKVAVIALLIVIPIRYFIFQPFVVKGISMEPTFHDGDYLIVDEISYRFRAPERGEVIVFSYPKNPSQKFIKRIVGLPGEEIELQDNEIIVKGKDGKETILNESSYLTYPKTKEWFQHEKIRLQKDEYFVLGDNRLHSFDSRSWGVLSRKYIIGRVLLRVFPPKAAAFFPAPSY